MHDPHAPLGAFLDGELTAEEAAVFRTHLAECLECQRDLRDFGALDALLTNEAAPVRRLSIVPSEPVAARRPARPRTWVMSAALLAAAAVTLVFVSRREPAETPLELAPSRLLEARVSWGAADAWRPYQPVRGANRGEALTAANLAALERAGDRRALAGAWLLAGNPERARQVLQDVGGDAAAADLAAIALAEGQDEAALAFAQRALDVDPRNPQAAWNRALALERLDLTRLAARRFHELAERGEQGWSEEASARAAALDATWQKTVERTQQALDAAARMVLTHEPMPQDLARVMPSTARMAVRYALLTATRREQVEALLPLAQALDAQLGGSALASAVTRRAQSDFGLRATRAPAFRALIVDLYRAQRRAGFGPLIADEEAGLGEATAGWVARLRREKAWDDLLLAIPIGRQLGAAFDDYAEAVARDGDPWFVLALDLERARRTIALGDAAQAERQLLELLPRAGTAPLRALQAREQLVTLLTGQHRIDEARLHAFEAMRLARAQGELATAGRLLQSLADGARFRNAMAFAAAALEEKTLRVPDDAAARDYLHESVAAMSVVSLDVTRAREELARVEGLSIVGLGVLADLMRLQPLPEDEQRFTTSLAALREAGVDANEGAMLTHLEGRARLASNPKLALERLRQSIAEANAAPDVDALPRKVVAHSFGLLRAAAAEASDWAALFTLTEEELRAPVPSRCALIIEVQDNHVAVAVRDGGGSVQGTARRFPFGARASGGLDMTELAQVAAPLATAAATRCAVLSVFASYPLHGRAGWLPDEVAWAFAGGSTTQAPRPGPALVVRDVATPPALGLPRLASWDDALRPGDLELSGEAATPQRVLEAMRGAALVELHAHAWVNSAESDTAALVLAPDGDGTFSLGARALAGAKLEAAPVVLLAACRASTVAPWLHEPWSLPRALLAAGASSVIAAPEDLPDAEARLFFGGVVARLRRGEPPAAALRDERLSWLQQHRASWVRSVLVFQ